MTDYNVMPDYQTRRKIINDICEKYSFVHHSFAGKSVCGRCIDVLHIGNTKKLRALLRRLSRFRISYRYGGS